MKQMKLLLFAFCVALGGGVVDMQANAALTQMSVNLPSTHVVMLDANGGTVTKTKVSFLTCFTKLGNLPTPKRSGYKFRYWTTVRNNPKTRVTASTYLSELYFQLGSSGKVYKPVYTGTLYAYWGCLPPSVYAVKDVSTEYVTVNWLPVYGAVKYKIRRATSSRYEKSKAIATSNAFEYLDKHPAKYPNKRYYYWVVAYDVNGIGTKSATTWSRYPYCTGKCSASSSK